MYVIGETPSIESDLRFINDDRNHVKRSPIYLHNDGHFMLVHFDSVDDIKEILYRGPYNINNKPIILKTWTLDFDFDMKVCTFKQLRVSFARILTEIYLIKKPHIPYL